MREGSGKLGCPGEVFEYHWPCLLTTLHYEQTTKTARSLALHMVAAQSWSTDLFYSAN